MNKLVYVDIQKVFTKSKDIYFKLKSKEWQDFISKFDKRYKIYDISNPFHYTFWFNKENLIEDEQNDILKVDEKFWKKFWWIRFWNWEIPKDFKDFILKNFNKDDNITFIWWYEKKCLYEVVETFKRLGYKNIFLDYKYIYLCD